MLSDIYVYHTYNGYILDITVELYHDDDTDDDDDNDRVDIVWYEPLTVSLLWVHTTTK